MPVPYTVTLYASNPSVVRLHIVLRYLMCLQKPDNPAPEYTSYVFDVTGSTWSQYVKKMILILNVSNQKDDLLLQFWSFVLKNDGIDYITKKQMWFISPLLVHNQELCQAFPDLAQDWIFAYSLLSRKNPQALLDALNERKKSGQYIYSQYLYVVYQAHLEHPEGEDSACSIRTFLQENSEFAIHKPDFPALLGSQFYEVHTPYSHKWVEKITYADSAVSP